MRATAEASDRIELDTFRYSAHLYTPTGYPGGHPRCPVGPVAVYHLACLRSTHTARESSLTRHNRPPRGYLLKDTTGELPDTPLPDRVLTVTLPGSHSDAPLFSWDVRKNRWCFLHSPAAS